MSPVIKCCCLLLLLSCQSAWGKSLRIEVYPISQQYWDVAPDESLSSIAAELLPNNPRMRIRLMDDIFRLNPEAFIDNDKDRLLAGHRLVLPGSMTRADTRVDKNKYKVRTFSWGNIKTPRD